LFNISHIYQDPVLILKLELISKVLIILIKASQTSLGDFGIFGAHPGGQYTSCKRYQVIFHQDRISKLRTIWREPKSLGWLRIIPSLIVGYERIPQSKLEQTHSQAVNVVLH